MYFEKMTKDNVTYSIDMLRLTTRCTYSFFTELEFRFDSVWQKYVKLKYNSTRITDFSINYNIEVEEGSFWFGFLHNSEKRSQNDFSEYNFTIEFNPNKLQFNKILLYILYNFKEWFIKSYDLAMDLPVNIVNVVGYEKGKCKDIRVISSGFDNKTIYIGKGNNRVKIYNKKLESNLDINGDLTRIEISKQLEDLSVKNVYRYEYDKIFPDLYLNEYLYSFKDYEDKTLFAVLYAVQNGFPLSDLSRTYKKKIKDLYNTQGLKIKFDNKIVGNLLRKVMYHYFVQPKSNLNF